jgi:hypothetical protein
VSVVQLGTADPEIDVHETAISLGASGDVAEGRAQDDIPVFSDFVTEIVDGNRLFSEELD